MNVPWRRDNWAVQLGPLHTQAGTVTLRPIRRRDAKAWSRLRLRDRDRLERWEPTTSDWDVRHAAAAWPRHCAALRAQARRGNLVPLAIEVDGKFAGQITVGNILRGQLQFGWVGYWVAESVGGGGVASAALALLSDHMLSPFGGGLHRLEATVQAENAGSRIVLTRSGFVEVGVIPEYLHVFGKWRDHLLCTRLTGSPSGVEALIAMGKAWR